MEANRVGKSTTTLQQLAGASGYRVLDIRTYNVFK